MDNSNNVNNTSNDTANTTNNVNVTPTVTPTVTQPSTPVVPDASLTPTTPADSVVVTDSNANNTKLIIATVAFVIGLGLLTFGIVNIMKGGALPKNPPATENSGNTENNNITVTEDSVRSWLDSNKIVVDYLVEFGYDFDSNSATTANYSDIFGWYFALKEDKQGTNLPEDNIYDIEYTMPREEVETFAKNIFGKTLDVIDVSTITLSKDLFNFTSDGTTYKLQAVVTDFTPNYSSELNNINIISDDTIEVTYGVMQYGTTCDSGESDCYTKYRVVTLTKADDGFNLLSSADEPLNNETDNNTGNNTTPDTNTDNETQTTE